MDQQEQPKRRANIPEEEVAKWREMEAAGKKRSAIAREVGYNPSVITRHLGKRVKAPVETVEP